MRYDIERLAPEFLLELEAKGHGGTVFTTCAWVKFLEKNQQAEPVVLALSQEGRMRAVFVGAIVKKAGVRILGSPFEGWLTPDMGFVRLGKIDVNEALRTVARYAFRELKCWFVQICDKSIRPQELERDIRYSTAPMLFLDASPEEEAILQRFTKNGRRDVRAFDRKGAHIVKVPFDRAFAERYYAQLIDVFDKQGLKPFYSLEKMYDLVDAFRDCPERVLALEARLEDETCIATVFSFGYGQWGYYMGAASFREYQKHLPNEGLFWAFVRHWNGRNIPSLDLVGYRKYKMKYAPELIDIPYIYFERVPGLLLMKNAARSAVTLLRKIKGRLTVKRTKEEE